MSNRIKDFVSKRKVQICVAVALFLAVADWPYGYYQFLRWAVCAGAAFSSWRSFQEEAGTWRAIGFVAIALLFNPFKVIHFPREEWAWIDVLAGLAFLVLAPTGRKKP